MSDATRPANLICWNERSRADRALVCIPWAGAGAAPFRRWVPVLGNATRIYGVRFAGREARLHEPPATAVDTVVAELADAITRLPEEQVDLFGHCSGAILAFEVARALRNTARGSLIVVGQVAPRHFAQDRTAVEDARRYIPEHISRDPELMELLVPVMATDLRAFAGYRYRAGDPLDRPITAIRGSRDPYVSDAQLAHWSEETTRPLVCRRVDDADHLFSGAAWPALAGHVLPALG